MSAARILLAALALAVAGTLFFRCTRGRPAELAPARAGPVEGAAATDALVTPVTASPEAPRREAASIEGTPAATELTAEAEAPRETPAKTIELLVTDPERRPLAGVRIRIEPGAPNEAAIEVTTNAEGRARLDSPARRNRFVLVEKEGHVHRQEYVELADGHAWQLPRAVRLVGRVLDASTRAPLAGARVARHHGACRACEPDEAEADAEGRYELAGVPAAAGVDTPWFVVEAAGYPTRSVSVDTSSAVDRVQYDFVLVRGTTLSGRVLGFPERTPLAATVMVDGQWLKADSDGRFEGQVNDAPGELRLVVRATERCTLCVVVPRERAHEPIEVLLPRTCTLEGTVRDRAGAPVPKAFVHAGAFSRDERAARDGLAVPEAGLPENHLFVVGEDGTSEETDAEGRYRIVGLPPVAETFLNAGARGFQRLDSRVDVALRFGATERVDLTLEALGCTGTVRGRIMLNGESVSCTVKWKGRTRSGYAWAKDDRYELVEVECGPVEVRADVDASGARVDLHVGAGTVAEHDFDLRRAPNRVVGTLRFEDGQPGAGLSVTLHHPTMRVTFQVESDAEGAYSCDVLAHAEPYTVTVVSAGDTHRRLDALVNGPPVDFVLPELVPLRFRTQDAESGVALDESCLSWRRPGETNFRLAGRHVPADAEGWRTVSVPHGPLELLARADGLGYGAARATGVAAGQPGGVTFALERGASVRFELARESEAFPADHVLFLIESDVAASVRTNPRACEWPHDPTGLYPWGELRHRQLRFSGDGGARLAGLDPGVHRFVVCPDDLRIEPAEVDVQLDASAPVSIRWSRRE